MVKRLISANPSDILSFNRDDLKQSIRASEGRVVLTETVAGRPAYIGDITTAEICRAFGSDMILLNGVDILSPHIEGLSAAESKDFVRHLHRLTGLPVGVNLEPVDKDANMDSDRIHIPPGRTASFETFEKANALGLDFICLTGNPGVGVSNSTIISSVANAKQFFNGLIIAGKMHGAGVAEPVLNKGIAEAIIDAGADVLLVPAVGTVPGVRFDDLCEIVDLAHSKGALVMSAIGTSQESSSASTIEQMAIQCKMAGVDIQHIGDAGYHNMANVENIMALSVAIRGNRHTISRIARSVVR